MIQKPEGIAIRGRFDSIVWLICFILTFQGCVWLPARHKTIEDGDCEPVVSYAPMSFIVRSGNEPDLWIRPSDNPSLCCRFNNEPFTWLHSLDYHYQSPYPDLFQIDMEGGPSPLTGGAWFLRIGFQAGDIFKWNHAPVNACILEWAHEPSDGIWTRQLRQAVAFISAHLREDERVSLHEKTTEPVFPVIESWIRNSTKQGYRNRYAIVLPPSVDLAPDDIARLKKLSRRGSGDDVRGCLIAMEPSGPFFDKDAGDRSFPGLDFFRAGSDADLKKILWEYLSGESAVVMDRVRMCVTFNSESVETFRLLGGRPPCPYTETPVTGLEDTGEFILMGQSSTSMFEIMPGSDPESVIGEIRIEYTRPGEPMGQETVIPIERKALKSNPGALTYGYQLAAAAAAFDASAEWSPDERMELLGWIGTVLDSMAPGWIDRGDFGAFREKVERELPGGE